MLMHTLKPSSLPTLYYGVLKVYIKPSSSQYTLDVYIDFYKLVKVIFLEINMCFICCIEPGKRSFGFSRQSGSIFPFMA